MTLRFIEGFDHYDSVAGSEDYEMGWDFGSANAITAGGRFGGKYLRLYGSHVTNYSSYLALSAIGVDSSAFDEFVVGVAVYHESSITIDYGIFRLYSGAPVNGRLVWTPANNRFEFWNENDDVIGFGGEGLYRTAGWQYFEMKIKMHNTAGDIIVRVDGVEIINETGVVTDYLDSGYVDRIALGNCTSYRRCDDFYLVEVDATAPNDFLGDCQVQLIAPDGDGNSSDWTPSTGNNYECIDENPPSDSDYVESETEGEIDLYTMDDVTLEAGQSILAVQSNLRSLKLAAGARVIKGITRIGGTNYDLGSKSILGGETDPTSQIFPAAVSPASGVAWTESELNGAELGIEVGGQT